METPITADVANLFCLYEKLNNEFDYSSVAKLFSGKFVAADPKDISFRSNNFITRWRFEKDLRTFAETAGFTSIRNLQLSEVKINEQYSLVSASWGLTFRKTQSQLFEFHASYIVRKRKGKTEIVMCIDHEDDKKVLEGYGILK